MLVLLLLIPLFVVLYVQMQQRRRQSGRPLRQSWTCAGRAPASGRCGVRRHIPPRCSFCSPWRS